MRNKLPKRTNLCSTIAKGNKLCDLMTINMEAFMRTVLFIGCSEDWPGYLNSKVYSDWLSKTYKVKATDNDDTEADDNAESEGMTTGGDSGDKSGSETMEGDPKDDPPTATMQSEAEKESGSVDTDTKSKPVSVCVCVSLFVPVGFHELN